MSVFQLKDKILKLQDNLRLITALWELLRVDYYLFTACSLHTELI